VKTYGPVVKRREYQGILSTVTRTNQRLISEGRQPIPLCVWGLAGVGKTQSIRDFALREKFHFLQINPAQFEEMGDITGMPRVHDSGTPNDPLDDVTLYIMPEWAKRMHNLGGNGILLLDDVNRADDRILRGIMQLLQDRRMFNWHLPQGWQIMLTANPDGADFSVTPMDDAILTRMMHCTMQFEKEAWAEWATAKSVDARGISFVLAYPELIGRGRTTPRSLTYLFEHLRPIPDLKAEISLISLLASSCIDTEAASSLVAFCATSLAQLPSPEDLLSQEWATIQPKLERAVFDEAKNPRVDCLTVMVQRVVAYARTQTDLPSRQARANLREFLLWDRIPREIVRLVRVSAVGVPYLGFIEGDDAITQRA